MLEIFMLNILFRRIGFSFCVGYCNIVDLVNREKTSAMSFDIKTTYDADFFLNTNVQNLLC